MIRQATVYLIALILSIAVHEFGHAFMANRLGDSTPRHQGRLTLNPLAHISPIGTIIIPLVSFFYPNSLLLGWGKPVQVNPVAFSRKYRMKTGHLFVAAAGPAMNIVLALLVTVVLGVLYLAHVQLKPELEMGIVGVIQLNWTLFFFNLLPCPPLDGGAVLAGLLPDRHRNVTDFLQQYGLLILFGLLATGVLGYLLLPAVYMTRLSMDLLIRVVS